MKADQPRPLVSIVVPAFNGERYLSEALESAIAQTWEPIEVLVVDDGSTDGTARIAGHFAPTVRYHYQPHAGLATARNTGIALTGGTFIAHLDCDDILTSDSLRVRMEAFAQDPSLDIVGGHVQQFVSPELDETTRAQIRCSDRPLAGHAAGAVVLRRDAFRRVGPLDTSWEIHADMDWFLRAQEAGLRLRIVPEIVLRRRIHGQNMGIRMRTRETNRLHILKAALDRRRTQSGEPQ